MSRVLNLELKVRGQWRDIWLYKELILLWQRDGTLRYLTFADAGKRIQREYGPAVGYLTQILIFRNDWKVGEQLKSMLQVPSLERALLEPFANQDRLEIELPGPIFRGSDSDHYSAPVLDTQIYANRIYMATRDGLLESYIHPKNPARSYHINVQIESRVSHLTVGYAAINASSEDRGLLFGRIHFSQEDDAAPGFLRTQFQVIADRSIRTSYARHHLLNYIDTGVPDLYRAQTEEVRTGANARFDDTHVVGYEERRDISRLTYSALRTLGKVGLAEAETVTTTAVEDLEVLGNSGNHMLVSVNDRLSVVKLNAFEGRDVEATNERSYRAAGAHDIPVDEILDVYPLSNGFIVELPGSLRLFNREGSHELIAGEIARVRTYPGSKRHKETIGVIAEESASIIGFHESADLLF